MKILTSIRPLDFSDEYKGLLDYIDLIKFNTAYQYINYNFKFLYWKSDDFSLIKDQTLRIKEKCDAYGLKILVTHGFYHNDFYLNEINENLSSKMRECIELSSLIGAQIIVFHSGIYFGEDGNYSIEETINKNVEFFLPVCGYASKFGIKVALENNVTSNYSNNGAAVEPNVIVLSEVTKRINEKLEDKVAGLCYDIGHAHLANRDIFEDLKTVKDSLLTFHIHCNNGYDKSVGNVWKSDLHRPISGTGIDYKRFFDTLKEIGFDDYVVNETNYRGSNEEIISQLNDDLEFFNKYKNK